MPNLLVKINIDDKGNPTIEKLADNVSRAKPKVKSLGDTMKKAFAVVGVYKGLNYLSASLQNAANEALKYEKAMKKVQEIGNETNITMGKIGKSIEQFALTTEHSFNNIAEAQLSITKAGIRGSEGIMVLKNALDLATVSGEEQGAVSEGLINILNAFGMGTENAGYAANVMSRALNETILNLEEYLEAMKYSAPVASQLGVSFEELSSIIGILAQTGQRGSLAGTGLRNVLLNMLKVTPETAEALKNVKIETMGVTQLLQTLHENGLPVVDLLKQFNKRGILAASALGANADKVYELQKRLTDFSRPLSTVADEIRDNLLDKLQMVNNHFIMILNTLNKEAGKGGSTVLDNLMIKLKTFNEELKQNPQLIKDWTNAFVALGNTLALLVPVLSFTVKHSRELILAWGSYKIATNIGNITKSFNTLKLSILGFVANPVSMGILGGAGLVAALSATISKAKDAKENLDMLQKTIDNFGWGAVDITTMPENIKKMALDLNTSYASFLKNMSEVEQKFLLGTLNVDKIKQVSSIAYNEAQRIWDLEAKLEKESGLTFSKDIEEKMRQINSLTGAYQGFIDKIKKPVPAGKNPFGSNLILEKTKSDLKDIYGIMFDITRFEQPAIFKIKVALETEEGTVFDVGRTKGYGAVQESLRKLQGNLTDTVYPVDMKANLETTTNIQKINDEGNRFLERMQLKITKDPLESLNNFTDKYQLIYTVSNEIMDLVASRRDFEHQRQMQIYDEEIAALTKRYNAEISAAGNSILQKSLAENAYEKKKDKIEDKQKEEEKRYATAQWRASMAQILLNGPLLISNLAVGFAKWNPLTAIPNAVALGSALIAAQLAVAAANNPAQYYFKGGKVKGNGNSTSDSVPAYLSKGEWVLSRDDVNRLGGDSVIERMITMGNNTYKNSTTIYINSIIGEETYVRRNLIPRIKEELKR